jgi:hypothetical protein
MNPAWSCGGWPCGWITPPATATTGSILLTTAPAELADAGTLADRYRTRWTVECSLLQVSTELQCEIEALGYPPAALFGFAVVVVAFNSLTVVKAALRSVYGAALIDTDVSGYSLAVEWANAADSFTAVLDVADWQVFQTLEVPAFVDWLWTLAARADLRQYRKHPRGSKKPAPKRTHDPRPPHVYVARLLNNREQGDIQ